MTDDTRRWAITLEALRQAAERLARAPDGWLVCQTSQFPQPHDPRQCDIEFFYLRQGH